MVVPRQGAAHGSRVRASSRTGRRPSSPSKRATRSSSSKGLRKIDMGIKPSSRHERRAPFLLRLRRLSPRATAPEKTLLEHQTRTGGRNHHGRITSRFRGGGHKQRYRIIDFRRQKIGVPAKVSAIEYDPNRTARIALLTTSTARSATSSAPDGLKVGDRSSPAATPTSSRATACRSVSSRSAPPFTTSS